MENLVGIRVAHTSVMRFVAILGLVTACAGPATVPDTDGGIDPPPSPTARYLTPSQHLTRASIALRGVRPAVEELVAVAADPAALGAIVDRYLTTPEFAATIRELHNETLLMQNEEVTLTFPATATFTATTSSGLNRSVFDEPLRLIEDIVMTDQPYSKVVTADYTMADGAVAAIWGFPHTGPFDQWERTAWPDARGAVGVLGVEAVYHRHRSAGTNYNRGRANLISRTWLCHDYAHADIQIPTDIDLADPDVVANAVVANPACAGCHQTLDPLASYLFPFRNAINIVAITRGTDDYPVGGFQANLVDGWKTKNKRPPGFFGQAASGLAGLGEAIAEDPRFARCAAQRFAAYLTETPAEDLDGRFIAALQADFTSHELSAKHLVKSIIMSDTFRLAGDDDAAVAESVVGLLKLRPQQMSRTLQDLTGFTWTSPTTRKVRDVPYGEPDLLDSDVLGFRVLAGGIDSFYVTTPVHTMNATSSLVARSAAAAAADAVVESDRTASPLERRLFTQADVTSTDETEIRAELAYLHARIYGELVAPSSAEVDQTYALFVAAKGTAADQRRAWKVTLLGMLTDIRFLYY